MRPGDRRDSGTLCRVTIHRWAWLPSLVLFACDNAAPEHPDALATDPATQAPAEDAAPVKARASSPASGDAKPRAPTGPTIVAIDVALVEVRTQGDVVEIEIELPRPLAPGGAMRPSLQIGDEVTQRSRAGRNGRLDRLIFSVPAAQYERMSPTADIVVRAGLFSNEASPAKPRLSEVK